MAAPPTRPPFPLRSYRTNGPYFGSIVGRVANRIAGAKFTLEGRIYELAANNGPNCLHGGKVGFNRRLWAGEAVAGGVRLALASPAGEEGFPAALEARATYTLGAGGRLVLVMEATADGPTPVMPQRTSLFVFP